MVADTLYSHERYTSIKSLPEACEEFTIKSGHDFIYNVAKPLLYTYNTNKIFGITLIYRPFDLKPTQKLVTFRDASMPWNVLEDENDNAQMPTLKPRKRMLAVDPDWVDGRISYMNYEHQAFAAPALKPEEEHPSLNAFSDFLAAFGREVHTAGLEGVVGLFSRPSSDFHGGLERVDGGAVVLYPPGEFADADLEDAVQTGWFWLENDEAKEVQVWSVVEKQGKVR
ncbi:hypothetical protein LTR10_016378 [Elasticomyces elasticus]|uniref:Uncharacterized protein n=1 Tax=Exophiala sideris TaxID=1016849 RepID=A0ABR0J5C2_9EURO|nr:hypothetical protein LTR10_016378 [Elasticomyces elasticus]KAK5028388.1 hypothetical protein LTS07_006479 [Exophiala sideris]KAK5035969.1 hypothetical protein LTR13_005539 [Exophiala sideris]KAK5057005.1 hypothetical protein LTR69_007643 [Exophiala sideris]KAK5181412.1 hypothetical protein LTR44_006207 [Eurotiomycetes sp. CCFEE 6388]